LIILPRFFFKCSHRRDRPGKANTAVFPQGQSGAFAGLTAQSMLQIAALAVTM
jgi:hypothetical protein